METRKVGRALQKLNSIDDNVKSMRTGAGAEPGPRPGPGFGAGGVGMDMAFEVEDFDDNSERLVHSRKKVSGRLNHRG